MHKTLTLRDVKALIKAALAKPAKVTLQAKGTRTAIKGTLTRA
jgi:hypothetical protein